MDVQIHSLNEGVWFYRKYDRFGDALRFLLNGNDGEAIIELLKRWIKRSWRASETFRRPRIKIFCANLLAL